MKNFLFITCLVLLGCIGCKKQETGCTPVKPEMEEPQILAYAAKDSINAVKDGSGVYYQIINPGSGPTPNANSQVTVTYVGKLLNETKFDQATSPVSFNLGGVIEGWQIGIPLIKQGGRIKLIIPSAYAYGCNGSGPIPPNAVLFFDVTITKVQ